MGWQTQTFCVGKHCLEEVMLRACGRRVSEELEEVTGHVGLKAGVRGLEKEGIQPF